MTIFTVHIYREMRLTFIGIDAQDPEDAARKAHDLSLEVAHDLNECEGETFAALVDYEDDDTYEHSRMIDFEADHLRKAATRLLHACRLVVDRWQCGDLAEAARACQDAIALVHADDLSDFRKPIIIEVRGGIVQDVLNVPPGCRYDVMDYDNLEEK
jgi:hypothetical protein